MQLTMEVLPAPFGPMIEKTSPRSTLKETSVSARTPPKRSETCSAARIGVPACMHVLPALMASSPRGCEPPDVPAVAPRLASAAIDQAQAGGLSVRHSNA